MRGLKRVEIYFDSMMHHGLYSPMMIDLEMLILGHILLVDDRFCEMTVYTRHILFRDYLILRAYPFSDDVFILGHSHLTDFWHWDLTFYLWLWFSMDHRVIDTLGLVFSTYLVWFGYPLTFVIHSKFRIWHCYTYIYHFRA